MKCSEILCLGCFEIGSGLYKVSYLPPWAVVEGGDWGYKGSFTREEVKREQKEGKEKKKRDKRKNCEKKHK